MSWDSCIVYINSASMGNYFAGDLVTGSVILEFNQKQKLNYLHFKIFGKCKAQWSRPMPTMPYIKIYSEKRYILDMDLGICDKFQDNSILAGVRKFDFRFTLPLDIPSSFKSSISEVRYFIQVEGKSSFKLKKEKKVAINVIAHVELSSEYFLIPAYHKCHKTFWNSKKISMAIKTHRGFAPNQYVPFEISLTNENKVKLTKIIVTLVQKVRYNVLSGHADDEKEKCKVKFDKLFNTVVERCCFGMNIPQTNPSTVNLRERMVEISYVFRVKLIFPFHPTLVDDVPVTISSVPVIHTNEFKDSKKTDA